MTTVRLFTHIGVATAGMHYSPSKCIYIHSLISVNILQALPKNNGAIFIDMEEFNNIPQLSYHISLCQLILVKRQKRTLTGRFHPYCHTTNIHFWRGSTLLTGDIFHINCHPVSSSSSCHAASMDLPDFLSPHPFFPEGLQGYILYQHRTVLYRF